MRRATVDQNTGEGWQVTGADRLDPNRVRAFIRRLDGPIGGWVSARRASHSGTAAATQGRRPIPMRARTMGHGLT
jgi:hypothetical protein